MENEAFSLSLCSDYTCPMCQPISILPSILTHISYTLLLEIRLFIQHVYVLIFLYVPGVSALFLFTGCPLAVVGFTGRAEAELHSAVVLSFSSKCSSDSAESRTTSSEQTQKDIYAVQRMRKHPVVPRCQQPARRMKRKSKCFILFFSA